MDKRPAIRQLALFLAGGKYTGKEKERIFRTVQIELDLKTINFAELGITEKQWADIEKEMMEKDAALPIEKMEQNEARVLAGNFGTLWREYRLADDVEKKDEMLNLLKSLWPRINHALTLRLVEPKDFNLEVGEYFEIANVINPPKK